MPSVEMQMDTVTYRSNLRKPTPPKAPPEPVAQAAELKPKEQADGNRN